MPFRIGYVFGAVWAMVVASSLLAGPDGVGGRVTAAGASVVGARVTLFTPTLSTFRETRTSGSGDYLIPGVVPGTYRLGVAARGYEYQEVQHVATGGQATRDFSLLPETNPGRWDIIGSTLPEFFDATDMAAVLPDGRVMFCHDTMDPVIFDPVTGTKTFPPGSGLPQGCMNTTLLSDGRVLIAGGQDGADPGNFRNAIPWVKTFDPAGAGGGTWVRHADMLLANGRWYPGMARLADGSVIVMGGGTRPDAARTATCERLSLGTMTWAYTGSLANPTEFSPAALLYTGEVLATWWPPQLYNPGTGLWRTTGSFVQPNRGWPNHSDHSMVILADGRALALGIRANGNGYTAMGERYDPATGAWSATATSPLPRFQSEVVQLPDGRVLAAAGDISGQMPPSPPPNSLGCVKWSELYDPVADTWRRVADMNWFREYHAVTVLVPDGRVVMTGGTRIKFQVGPTSADIEAFVPPCLLRGVRPQIAAISPAAVQRGRELTLTIAPQTQITSVVLMGSPTHTHWVDAGVPRRLVLPAHQTVTQVKARVPWGVNAAPLGYYMVFAMVDDIPSVARIVRLDTNPCPGDFDGDGSVTPGDVAGFVNAWFASLTDGTLDADFNSDRVVAPADIAAFVNAWFAALTGGGC